MKGQLTALQMSVPELSEPLWCERTQDMSGYVMPDIISPPLDEEFDFTISTAQHENDFIVQNSGYPSPEEFILGDQTEAVLDEDSNMFENSNYSVLHTKIKEWLPNISTVDIDEFAKTSMIDRTGGFLPHIDSENTLIFSETSKENKKSPASVVKKPRYLSIFDSEEPHIKEDPDMLASCCTDNNKLTFDLRDEMEVAEEVVVMTEQDESKFHLGSFLFDSSSLEFPIEPKEEVVITSETEELSSPLSKSYIMETSYDMGFDNEDLLCNLDSPISPMSMPKVYPPLHLDIEAAMVSSSSQLFCGPLPDTPEVLKPVLLPGAGFDLVNFLLANSDSNNNAVIPTASSAKPCESRLQEQVQGKSHLSLSDLKECHKPRRGKLSPNNYDEQQESTPGPSTTVTSSRPTRKSATKFKKLLKGGFLSSPLDTQVSSDDEDCTPKTKRRRSISSSASRKRLNSDSDRSSICENNQSKYRERRDRNNLSSKRSRQKRKTQQELKKVELKELEEENKRLKKRAEELAAVLDKFHAAWKQVFLK